MIKIDSTIINVNKPISKTPFEVAEKLRQVFKLTPEHKIGYAGRLDPLAQGVLLLMTGEECRNRDKYQNLKKTYEFKILLGIATDTYDPMGLFTQEPKLDSINEFEIAKIAENLQKLEGEINQPYPPFSSYHVNGKPLFYWAKEKKLHEIEIPTKKIEIYKSNFLQIKKYTLKSLIHYYIEIISNVSGDFRQNEIITQWKSLLAKYKNAEKIGISVICAELEVQSGTYVRSIANLLGNTSGLGAIAFDITRKKAGNFKLSDSLNLY